MTREELLVTLAAMMLAMPEDRPVAVAVEGPSAVGKTTLADELAEVVDGAGRPVLQVSYDDFHQPRETRHRRDRLSAEGYLLDSYDGSALRRLVLDPLRSGAGEVRTASFDLAADCPVTPDPEPVPANGVVIVEGEFLLAPQFDGVWDLGVLLVADPEVLVARAAARDTDLGTPDEVRNLYLRRYLAAWALHEEGDDPWSRADVLVDLSDPRSPRLLG